MNMTLSQPLTLRAPGLHPHARPALFLRAAPRSRPICRAWRKPGLVARVAARQGGPERDDGSLSGGPPPEPSGWLTFWGTVDATAWLGAMGTAAAFLITQEAMLAAAPVVLPLVALFASKQRERLAAEASQQELARRSQALLERMGQLARGAAGEAAATQIARGVELQQQAVAASAGTLRALEAKLAAVEGSVLSTSSTTRDALKESSAAQGQANREMMTRIEALATAVRRDVVTELRQAGVEEMAVLSRVEARLVSLEGAIRSLEATQGDGLRRLSSGIAASLQDAERGLQGVVRWEVERALEPLQRLPQLLAQAMPVTPEVLSPERPAAAQLSEESLRALLAEQLAAASREVLAQQAALLQELRAQPQVVAPQQWNQLGSRLVSLQEEVRQLLAAQEAAGAALAAAAARPPPPSAGAELAPQLAALRADVAALAASVESLMRLAAPRPPAAAAGQGMEEGLAAAAAAGGEEELADEVDPGLVGRLGAAALGAWQQERQREAAAAAQQAQQAQQAQLEEVVQLLRGLAGRLDGLGGQVAVALAAQQQAQAPAPGLLPAAGAEPAAAPAREAEGANGSKEQAYRRMQELLAGREGATAPSGEAAAAAAAAQGLGGKAAAPVQPAAAASSSDGGSGVAASGTSEPAPVPIRDWLSGSGSGRAGSGAGAQQSEPQPAAVPVGAGSGAWPAGTGAPPEGADSSLPWGPDVASEGQSGAQASTALGVSSSSSSSNSSGQGATRSGGDASATPFLQGQIAYGAALGVYAPVEQEPQQVPGDSASEKMASGAPATAPATAAAPPATQAAAAPPQLQPQPPPQQQQQQPEDWAPEPPQAGWEASAPNQPATWDTAWDTGRPEAVAAGPSAPPAAQPAAQPPQAPAPLAPAGPQEAAVAPPPAPSFADSLAGLGMEELLQRGKQRLSEGREVAATPGGDLGLADLLLWEAEECFYAAVSQQPGNIRALGNLGNALMAHGRLRVNMLRLLPPASAAGGTGADAEVEATRERLEKEAQEILLLAGRQYRAVLELDGSQRRAATNWGTVLCMRAELEREAGRLGEAAELFGIAADKFDAALDMDPQNAEAMRQAGAALIDMAQCVVDSDRKQAKQLLRDARTYLENALGLDPQDTLSSQKLEECALWAEYARTTK